jgi:Cd2+/Zn2+-exporting ATPase
MINTDPNHVHTYDEHGRMTCCTLEEKVYAQADARDLLTAQPEAHAHDGHDHTSTARGAFRRYLPAVASMILLTFGIVMDNMPGLGFFDGFARLIWYAIAYLPVGLPVMKDAIKSIRAGELFTEFTLMILATIGAFAIGEYPEGVAVMLFYAVGELFQSAAVNRAKSNIKALLDVRPSQATVLRNGNFSSIRAEAVKPGEMIQVLAGEKVPLDSIMVSDGGSFNTAALTGESRPYRIMSGEVVLAGMVNLDKVVEMKVTKKFADSAMARILDMVQHATARKAKTEQLIRKFAKVYTPIVFVLALAVVVVPYFILTDYVFEQWLYRSLIFLVVSCPCALVISIPLGYFGGIGAASRNGILFKGSNYLDLMTRVNTVVMDKTGTLTKGVFKVQKVVAVDNERDFISIVKSIESKSTHPLARAIVAYATDRSDETNGQYLASDIEELSGHGLRGKVNGKAVVVGNVQLFKRLNISYDLELDKIAETVAVVAFDGRYAGYVVVADEVKDDAAEAVRQMRAQGVSQIVMLSGDKDTIAQKVASQLGIDMAFGELLPQDKVRKVEELKKDPSRVIAFVGDGINDAPVLALSDVGIAMGAMGSDAAIETANVVIQTDQPSKIATAISIGRATRGVVLQNIALAFGVKAIVLILGAGGLATMWEAVFADVGVALLAILNAVRIQRMNFSQ